MSMNTLLYGIVFLLGGCCGLKLVSQKKVCGHNDNKIQNLLGPLKMCCCDVVLNCYSIVVP